ncbi:MAG: aspartate aminotransferase, partial [Pseudomonadota bacterium]
SGVPTFHQPAGVVALSEGQSIAREQIDRAARGRDIVCSALDGREGVSFAWPDGAFYLLFKIDGVTDSLKMALQLVDEANLGLAPGAAFGQAGEGAFRLCYLRSPDQLETAMARLTGWLDKR